MLGRHAQFGGQTPLNLAYPQANGVNIIGTSQSERAEDREMFADMLHKLVRTHGLAPMRRKPSRRPAGSVIRCCAAVLRARRPRDADRLLDAAAGYALRRRGFAERPVLVDKFLEDAVEVDVDRIADVGITTIRRGPVVGGMLEHVGRWRHSGDAAMVLPPPLSDELLDTMRRYSDAMARELKVTGLMNVQYAIKDCTVYVLEVNPRASRTVPFTSKAIGTPLAKLAAKVMAGNTLKKLGFTGEIVPDYWAVKESVFPFNRFLGQDILLSPEMKSTGEVMGLDTDLGTAYAKSQMAAGGSLPLTGRVFISVSDNHKSAAVDLARRFTELGFELISTSGTAAVLKKAGLEVESIYKLAEGRPNTIDLLKNNEIQLVINTPDGQVPRADEIKIRTTAVYTNTPIITTIGSAKAALEGIAALKEKGYGVKPLQEFL